MAVGFGLKPVGRLGGGQYRVRAYVAAATEGNVLGLGEAVELDGGIDTATQLPTVKLATAGNVLLGAVTGFRSIQF